MIDLLGSDNSSREYEDLMGTLGWVHFDIGNPSQAILAMKIALKGNNYPEYLARDISTNQKDWMKRY